MTLEDFERSDRTEYTLEDGKRFTITRADRQSSKYYVPEWFLLTLVFRRKKMTVKIIKGDMVLSYKNNELDA